MKTKIQIKSVFGSVLFELEKENNSIKDTLINAVSKDADLRGAYLQGAYLQDADLRGADLQGAYLQDADLRGADLQGAYLRGAYLQDAYLRGADLQGAYLRGAYLRGAYLRGADLQGAYLRGAYLQDADLRGADLQGADLRGADLQGAYLRGADLQGADLRGADLQGADLRGADLQGADLRGAKNSELIIAQTRILPEGDLIGWKKCKNDIIVKLLIPSRAKRSHAFNRKCRAEFVKVLQVIGAKKGVSVHDNITEYVKDKIVKCDKWDENFQNECSGGIHFFITKIEAENY